MLKTSSPQRSARETRMAHWNDGMRVPFPVDPYEIAKSLGITVRTAKMDDDTAGFILKEPGGAPEIYLNALDHEVRQRFTLAHELGHFVLNVGQDRIGYVDKRDELASQGVSPVEIWCNRFAAELLMPAAILKKWWARGDDPESIRARMNVSKPAFANRLTTLGLLRD